MQHPPNPASPERARPVDPEPKRRGFNEAVGCSEGKLTRCHASNVPAVEADLASARRGEGGTLVDLIVDIVRAHGPGGIEAEDGVWLELE